MAEIPTIEKEAKSLAINLCIIYTGMLAENILHMGRLGHCDQPLRCLGPAAPALQDPPACVSPETMGLERARSSDHNSAVQKPVSAIWECYRTASLPCIDREMLAFTVIIISVFVTTAWAARLLQSSLRQLYYHQNPNCLLPVDAVLLLYRKSRRDKNLLY